MPDYTKQYKASGVTARLFDIIQKMSDEDQLKLLNEFGERRLHTRKPYITPVRYETPNGSFCDYIMDISCGGVFILTEAPLDIGQEIILSFSLHGIKDPFTVTAAVVRKTTEGVGTQFINISKKQQQRLKTFIESI